LSEQALYDPRFSPADGEAKDALWQILCADFFQRWVPEDGELRPRFPPYSTKSRLPSWPVLMRLHLRLPVLHRLLGKQMFIVAVRLRA
jgi:hypothetical protein